MPAPVHHTWKIPKQPETETVPGSISRFIRAPASSGSRLHPRIDSLSGVVAALGNTSGLTAQSAQVVQLGAAHTALTHELDGVDGRGVHREATLHTSAEADLRTTKVSRTPAPLRDDHAGEGLDTGVVAFLIFTFTSTVSPGRKAGISSAGFMCLASKASTALTIVFLQCCRISATISGPSTRLRITCVGLFSLSLGFALGKPADPPKVRPCGRSDWTHGDVGLCGGPLLDTAIVNCTDYCGTEWLSDGIPTPRHCDVVDRPAGGLYLGSVGRRGYRRDMGCCR